MPGLDLTATTRAVAQALLDEPALAFAFTEDHQWRGDPDAARDMAAETAVAVVAERHQAALTQNARLLAALHIAVRSNVMCRHRLATTPEELAEHMNECSQGTQAIVAHEGNADEVVATFLAAGWTLSPVVEFVAGKRIRVVVPPAIGPAQPLAAIDDGVQETGTDEVAGIASPDLDTQQLEMRDEWRVSVLTPAHPLVPQMTDRTLWASCSSEALAWVTHAQAVEQGCTEPWVEHRQTGATRWAPVAKGENL